MILEEIGPIMREIRKEMKMTTEDVAGIVGVDCSTISRFERGTMSHPVTRARVFDLYDECEIFKRLNPLEKKEKDRLRRESTEKILKLGCDRELGNMILEYKKLLRTEILQDERFYDTIVAIWYRLGKYPTRSSSEELKKIYKFSLKKKNYTCYELFFLNNLGISCGMENKFQEAYDIFNILYKYIINKLKKDIENRQSAISICNNFSIVSFCAGKLEQAIEAANVAMGLCQNSSAVEIVMKIARNRLSIAMATGCEKEISDSQQVIKALMKVSKTDSVNPFEDLLGAKERAFISVL